MQYQRLTSKYEALPHVIPFQVPGFEKTVGVGSMVYTPRPMDCSLWFNDFVDKIESSIGRTYLPVCRLSDGEFEFLLGWQPLGPRSGFPKRLKGRLLHVIRSLQKGMDGRPADVRSDAK